MFALLFRQIGTLLFALLQAITEIKVISIKHRTCRVQLRSRIAKLETIR